MRSSCEFTDDAGLGSLRRLVRMSRLTSAAQMAPTKQNAPDATSPKGTDSGSLAPTPSTVPTNAMIMAILGSTTSRRSIGDGANATSMGHTHASSPMHPRTAIEWLGDNDMSHSKATEETTTTLNEIMNERTQLPIRVTMRSPQSLVMCVTTYRLGMTLGHSVGQRHGKRTNAPSWR
jgi:hypothetical protein